MQNKQLLRDNCPSHNRGFLIGPPPPRDVPRLSSPDVRLSSHVTAPALMIPTLLAEKKAPLYYLRFTRSRCEGEAFSRINAQKASSHGVTF